METRTALDPELAGTFHDSRKFTAGLLRKVKRAQHQLPLSWLPVYLMVRFQKYAK